MTYVKNLKNIRLMITEKTYKALKVLENTSFSNPMTANSFALILWGEDEDKRYLFTAVSNGGNGACAGKKAWLCAGSMLGRMAKKGLVKWYSRTLSGTNTGYCITNMGKRSVEEYEKYHKE